MKVDTVITLKNGENYLLLLESEETEKDYFLAVLLDEKNEPTDKYEIFEQKIKDDKILTRKVKDPFLIQTLLEDFEEQNEEEAA